MMMLGTIENQTSLIWTRRYQKPGSFELYAPITDKNRKLLSRGNLIFKKGSNEAGVIEDFILEESNIKNQITVKGRFLSSYMDRRLIKSTITFSGTVEEAMRMLISSVETIPKVEMGELQGFEETVSFQVTYKNLLSYIEKLAKSANLGFRFRPDFNDKKIYFEVYRGIEKTVSAGITQRVIFSESYNNLNNASYRENDQAYKNVAYVGGEGEGEERTYVTVGEAEGLELREIFVDAKDIRSDGLSDEEYKDLLRQRGYEALNENALTKSFECETRAEGNYKYKVDYDLGDIVTVKKRGWEITEDECLTEIQEIYEHGEMRVVPTLGTALSESIDWSE